MLKKALASRCFFFSVALCLLGVLAFAATAGSGNPGEVFSWKETPNLTDSIKTCHDEIGPEGEKILVCSNGCPTNSICAEFSNDDGTTLATCCIPSASVGSEDPYVCLDSSELFRGGGEEIWLDDVR